MLIYKLPLAKTTANKVAVWRKLKKLGVFPIQKSVCILPHSERTLEHFEWLAAEFLESGGQASVWEAESLNPSQEKDIRDFFLDQVNGDYRKIIQEAALAKTERQVRALWARFNKLKGRDYLKSPLAAEAKAACEELARKFQQKEESN
jgi:hypothetical protein